MISNSINPKAIAVAQNIFTHISAGTLPMGSQITEKAVCESLKVPRTHIREAFALLENQNIIERNPRRGYQIVSIDEQGVASLTELITALALQTVTAIIQQSYQQTSQQTLLEFKEILIRLKHYTDDDDLVGFNNTCWQLFLQGALATQNQVISDTAKRLELLSRLVLSPSYPNSMFLKESISLYCELYTAIIAANYPESLRLTQSICKQRYRLANQHLTQLKQTH